MLKEMPDFDYAIGQIRRSDASRKPPSGSNALLPHC